MCMFRSILQAFSRAQAAHSPVQQDSAVEAAQAPSAFHLLATLSTQPKEGTDQGKHPEQHGGVSMHYIPQHYYLEALL